MATSTPDFDSPSLKVPSPAKFAHVVLRTSNIKAMVDYYTRFLNGHIVYENPAIAFITYDDEHHRIAFIEVPGTAPKVHKSCGLEHTAYTFPTLSDLLLAYRARKQQGIEPTWCVNHGPSTSIYYTDPDGNMIETQVDNFDTPAKATEFMSGPYFAENPFGTDFDPEDLIKRLKNGEDEEVLKKRVEIGPRGPPDFL